MKIGIADPQASIRFGLRVLLEQQEGWQIISEASDCQDLIGSLTKACPDLLLLDWDLPGMFPVALIRRVKEPFPALRIISLSTRQEVGPVALAYGVDAFTCKTESPVKLLSQIQRVWLNKSTV